MASLNKIFLIGNLTRDPEVRYTPSGTAVADLNLAVNRKYKSSDGELKEDVCYVKIDVWSRTAENCGKYLKKGSSILVEGSLRYHEWESNGEKRNRLSVNAERIQFMSRGRGAEDKSETEGISPGSGTPPAEDAVPPPAAAEMDDNLPF